MAIEITLRKLYDTFTPVDKAGMDLFNEIPMNSEFKATLTQPRNIRFHRKYFTLLNFAFDNWDAPTEVSKRHDIVPLKSREQFRKDIVILSGYYDVVRRLDGSEIIIAKSISFAKMDDTEFTKLYSTTIDIILSRVLSQYTKDDLNAVVDRLLAGYA